MVALARNLDFARPRFLASLTAVFVARLRGAPAWKMCTLSLLSCRHHGSPLQKPKVSDCRGCVVSLPCAEAAHPGYEVISGSRPVGSQIDLSDLRELKPEAAECGSLDRFRWLPELLCNHLHQRDPKPSQSARHTLLCARTL